MTRAAWRFFREWSGGVVGEAAIGAASLARAEEAYQRDEDAGRARIVWEDEAYPDLSWLDEDDEDPRRARYAREELQRLEDGRSSILVCALEKRCPACGRWETAASVCGVHVRQDQAGAAYKRVVAAELAAEVYG